MGTLRCFKGARCCRGFRCCTGLCFGFMITCFIGCFNDMLIEEKGSNILFRQSKLNDTERFRHGIH